MIPLTEAERAQIQADHEAFMTSTVTIGTEVAWVYDDTTGTEARTVAEPYYDGKAKVQSAQRASSATEAGAQALTLAQVTVVVPASVSQVGPGHDVLVLASPDPALVGANLTVQSVASAPSISPVSASILTRVS